MMSNRDGFGSGFWLGTLVGGVVGGIVGATIASQRANNRLDDAPESGSLESERGERRPFKASRMRSIDRMEVARRSLDDKIGDLNNAIDAVRASINQVPSDSVDVLAQRAEAEQNSQPSAAD
jgi:hypothetical protein